MTDTQKLVGAHRLATAGRQQCHDRGHGDLRHPADHAGRRPGEVDRGGVGADRCEGRRRAGGCGGGGGLGRARAALRGSPGKCFTS
jgi:hypothetical protein